MSKRRGRRKKRFPVALLIVIIVVVVAAGVGGIVYAKKFAPTTDTVNLTKYYNLDAYTKEDGTEVAAAADDEIAIVLEDEITEERALLKDGHAYIKYSYVRNNVDSRFYYDSINKKLIVTNALQTITADAGQTGYSVDGESKSTDYAVTIEAGDTVYICADFMDEFSSSHSTVCDNPRRVMIAHETGTFKVATAKKNTQIRIRGGNKSEVVSQLAKGSKVTVLEDLDDWLEVVDETGYIGYVKTNALSKVEEETRESDYDEPEYTHITFDGKINMAWQAVYYYGGDEDISELAASADSMNVVSPRWYALEDTEGTVGISSRGEYVEYAHEQGWKVWAMMDDVSTEYSSAVLTDTNKRQKVINTIVEDAMKEGVDGLNVDFERISTEDGEDYIQFIRELSIVCRRNGITLSVDNYTPYSYNECYHVDEQNQVVDYVVIMAYDNYLGTGEAGPNSGLTFLAEVMSVTLEQVDEDRLVIALPFYSRLWVDSGEGNLEHEEYGMDDTRSIVANNGAEFTWDSTEGLNYAEYESSGATVKAWLEDADSIDAKLSYLSTYNIAGVSWWRLGQESSDVWETISKYY